MQRERITEEEVRSAVRSSGLPAMEDAVAVVLETDGSMSILKGGNGSSFTSLKGVLRPDGVLPESV